MQFFIVLVLSRNLDLKKNRSYNYISFLSVSIIVFMFRKLVYYMNDFETTLNTQNYRNGTPTY